MTEYKVDALGEMCPVPLIKAEAKLKEIKPGDTVVLITDHSCTLRFLSERLRRVKCSIDYQEVIEGVWEIYIEKLG